MKPFATECSYNGALAGRADEGNYMQIGAIALAGLPDPANSSLCPGTGFALALTDLMTATAIPTASGTRTVGADTAMKAPPMCFEAAFPIVSGTLTAGTDTMVKAPPMRFQGGITSPAPAQSASETVNPISMRLAAPAVTAPQPAGVGLDTMRSGAPFLPAGARPPGPAPLQGADADRRVTEEAPGAPPIRLDDMVSDSGVFPLPQPVMTPAIGPDDSAGSRQGDLAAILPGSFMDRATPADIAASPLPAGPEAGESGALSVPQAVTAPAINPDDNTGSRQGDLAAIPPGSFTDRSPPAGMAASPLPAGPETGESRRLSVPRAMMAPAIGPDDNAGFRQSGLAANPPGSSMDRATPAGTAPPAPPAGLETGEVPALPALTSAPADRHVGVSFAGTPPQPQRVPLAPMSPPTDRRAPSAIEPGNSRGHALAASLDLPGANAAPLETGATASATALDIAGQPTNAAILVQPSDSTAVTSVSPTSPMPADPTPSRIGQRGVRAVGKTETLRSGSRPANSKTIPTDVASMLLPDANTRAALTVPPNAVTQMAPAVAGETNPATPSIAGRAPGAAAATGAAPQVILPALAGPMQPAAATGEKSSAFLPDGSSATDQGGGFAAALAAPDADTRPMAAAGIAASTTESATRAPLVTPAPQHAAPTIPVPVSAQPGRIGREAGVAIARRIVDGGQEVTLRLNPAELGRIEVRIAFEDGNLRATMRADNAVALDLLRRDSVSLTQALDQAGVRADASSFRFESRSGDGNQQGAGRQPPHPPVPSNRGEATATETTTIPQSYRPVRTSGRVDLVA